MSDADSPRKKAGRQIRRHLDALKAAGVEFVPANRGDQTFGSLEPIPPVGQGGRPSEPQGTSAPAPLGSSVDAAIGAAISVPTSGNLFDSPSGVPESPDARRHALSLLAERVAKCDRCKELFATRTQTVFGVGPVSPDLCFIGEAPGGDEDRLGEPFVGAAGQLLNKIIAAMGMRREDVYICNVIKCRPPQNRTPSPQECLNCRDYFERQIELVGPRYICCLGAVAAQNVLGSKLGITKLRGRFHDYKGIPVLCTFHPAALLRNPGWKRDVWEDMKLLLRTMGRPVPGR
jgi:uracil-DNA glycosylase family 4